MEALPAITLVTADAVLAEAIPAQLQQSLHTSCHVEQTVEAAFHATPPALLILDCAAVDFSPSLASSLRHDHPLTALVAIGAAEDRAPFEELALCAFLPRPLAMGQLLRELQRLAYARTLHAGEQRLPLPLDALFLPAARQIVTADGRQLPLTDKESALLACLYHHRHGGLTRADVLGEVWGYGDHITTHTLETHLYRLRAKLREAFGEQELIATRQGRYYLQL